VGLEDRRTHRPSELSGGQAQRVAVARALITRPAVVFADEPTAPLHRADRGQVLRILTSAARSHGITVLLASTDPEVVSLADRAISLVDGRTVAGMPAPSQERESEGQPPCSASV
jgi:putative ABC transport system ATP-binding protein